MQNRLDIYSEVRCFSCSDSLFEWRYCPGEFAVRHHFDDAEWNNIVSDIHTDEELQHANRQGYLSVYMLFDKFCDESVGFIFILVDDPVKRYVSIHGGSWDNSRPLMLMHAYMLMILRLLKSGLKVHTSCKCSNRRAIHFNDGLRFITYMKRDDYLYKYITLGNLQKSRLYRRLSINY